VNRRLPVTLVLVGLAAAIAGSATGAPLITAVASGYGVPLVAAQWTLTVALLSGAMATPLLGRLGSGPRRRQVVLATLVLVVVGGALPVLPLPFALVLTGRAMQGVGLGLTPLLIATAREHLPAERAAGTIAQLSVASTVGVGVGYPLAGLLVDVAGVRVAYGFGLVASVVALVAAFVGLPGTDATGRARVDPVGAGLLALGLLAVLVVIGQTTLWQDAAGLAGVLLAAGLAVLAGWTFREARRADPLVDVRLLRHPAVAAANGAMLVGGVAMYLLLSLIVRYVQTPAGVGYGFGLDAFRADLVLVPFSALGFLGGALAPRLRRRLGAPALLALGVAVLLVAFAVFALVRGTIAGPVGAMAVLGYGVGTFSAAMPALILAATPAAGTAAAMGVNQVVRSTGFALGSALGGLVLAAATPLGAAFPAESGYTLAAWIGAAVVLVTALAVPLAARPAVSRHHQ
jgi:predicted MFS family arabinose efflux permease